MKTVLNAQVLKLTTILQSNPQKRIITKSYTSYPKKKCTKAGGSALSIMGLMFSLIKHLEDRNDVNNLYTIPQR